ncbi:uncharacterized protein [Solanum lycopersicum]|uniref:uncharacterized protein n=1 Tax=Solanum lycopersicum TaxID=4081 RepID=UPI003749CBC8
MGDNNDEVDMNDVVVAQPTAADKRTGERVEVKRRGIQGEYERGDQESHEELHYISEVDGLSYKDLYIHPNLDLPEGFKVPKFIIFNGTGNPLAHLKVYCDQLVVVGKDEALLMCLFGRSLSGEALEWLTSQELKQWKSWNALAKDFTERFGHNVEDAPDRYYLEKIKQKSTENYLEYAFCWRKEAARVQPPMSEREITEMFICTQEPEYYERMVCMMGQKFVEIAKVGEALEDGFKTGKITKLTALRSNGKSTRISDMDKSKGKMEEVFDKRLEMTATNSNSAEFVKEDESVFIFLVNELSHSPRYSFF